MPSSPAPSGFRTRFSLLGLFVAVAVVAAALAFFRSSTWQQLAASNTFWLTLGAVVLSLLLAAAHVAGNYWGERVNPRLHRQACQLEDPATRELAVLVPRGTAARVPETHLRSRQRLHLSVWVLVALGSLAGLWLGTWYVRYMAGERLSWGGVALGALSGGVICGVLTFAVVSCTLGVLRGLHESGQPVQVQLESPQETDLHGNANGAGGGAKPVESCRAGGTSTSS